LDIYIVLIKLDSISSVGGGVEFDQRCDSPWAQEKTSTIVIGWIL